MRLKKHIALVEDDSDFVLIFCANSNWIESKFCRFQWYLSDSPNAKEGQNIKGATSASFYTTSDEIRKNYMNKWLACRCEINGHIYNKGYVYLTDDFIKMIRCQQFDTILFSPNDKEESKVSYKPG